MDNLTFRYSVLLVEGLQVTPQSSKLTFISLLIAYVFVMVSNIWILIQISAEKSLHQPMHILYCHLPVSDIMGSTVVIPRLLKDLLTDPSERYITYVECVFQAFFAHLYGTTAHTILMIMAFDRYVAICNPLRYPTIMSNKMIVKLSAGAWVAAVVPVSVLIGLSVRLSQCRSVIPYHFCDNASIFKLSCESTMINNIYGLTFTVVLLTSSLGWVLLTYLKIVMVCIKSKNKATNSKAIKTCSTHLTVYIILIIFGFVPIFLHRFSAYAESRKFGSAMFYVIPPGLNPIIYGLQVKEIRQRMLKLCRKKVYSN
ncbi:putative gustatory receptor clone PTE03 [Pimephales promelas]|uniref:putative gustatory receptor clone PTE03 n=1 Tax=Pimephales promelas TaxID=90988 RepID=UPI00195573FE|nr:putative gustatory receptor clone PTE03 [Pimephales promelas]